MSNVGQTMELSDDFLKFFELGKEEGRAAMARELLAALYERAEAEDNLFDQHGALLQVMRNYRARFPVTEPDKDESEDGDNGGR